MTDESKYERARAFMPGLLGYSQKREMFLMALTAAAVLFAFGSGWRSAGQLAECKQEKQQGFVVAVDGDGNRVNLPIAEADQWRLSDGMVVNVLGRTVQCLRGLDSVPKHVAQCWKDAAPLFFGAESVKQFEVYNQQRFPSVDAILKAQAEEFVTVELDSWSHPDDVPNRFWLKWTETHNQRNGRAVTETWSGTFDVNLVPMQKIGGPPLQIVRWKWQCDAGECKAKVQG